MKYVVAALVVLPVLWLVVASIRGRASIRSCCPADPSLDLRIRGAVSPSDVPGPRADQRVESHLDRS